MNKDIQKMSIEEFIDYLNTPKKKPSLRFRWIKFYVQYSELIWATAIVLLQLILFGIWLILVIDETR